MDLLSSLIIIISLPLLVFLPGAVALAALPREQDAEARPSGLVEAVWRVVSVSLALSGWLGLLLAELGWFSLPLVLALVVGGSLAVWLWRGRPRLPLVKPTPADLAPLAVLVVGLALFSPPHETLMGATAPGTYLFTAANIANSGHVLLREPGFAALDPADQAMLVWPAPETPGMPLRFPDFYLADASQGVSLPQVFPLYPVWLAVLYSQGGLWAALWSLPVWGALGLLGVFYAGRWAFGTGAATVGALGLALTAPQIWFSRYTTAEAFTQALLWAGLFAFAVYVTAGYAPRLGLLAGLALGGVLLTRIDTPFILALPAGLVVWAWALRRHAVLLIPITLLAIHALVHALLFATSYVRSTSLVLPQLTPLLGVVALAALVVAGIWRLGMGDWGLGRRLQSLIPTFGQSLPRLVLAVAILALGVWGWFVRPALGEPLRWSNWYSGEVVAYPHLSLVQLGWYLSPIGVWLGILGAAWAAYRGPGRRVWLVLAVGMFFAVLYLWNPLNSPRHIYMVRRYVPVVFPAFALCAGYALVAVARLGGQNKKDGRSVLMTLLGAGLALTLAVATVAGFAPVAASVRAQREGAGVVGQYADIAARFEPNAVLLFANTPPMGHGAIFGTPLQLLYGRESYTLQGEVDGPRLARLAQAWQDAGRPVYVLAGNGPLAEGVEALALAPVGKVALALPTLETPFDHPPTEWFVNRPSVGIYRVGTGRSVGEVDVGGPDLLAVTTGWHHDEDTGRETFRWTQGDAVVRAPWPVEARVLRLRLAGPRPEGTPTQVFVNGVLAETLNVTPGFHEYSLLLPDGLQHDKVAEVRLVSPLFTAPDPKETRKLGVMVDWMRVE